MRNNEETENAKLNSKVDETPHELIEHEKYDNNSVKQEETNIQEENILEDQKNSTTYINIEHNEEKINIIPENLKYESDIAKNVENKESSKDKEEKQEINSHKNELESFNNSIHQKAKSQKKVKNNNLIDKYKPNKEIFNSDGLHNKLLSDERRREPVKSPHHKSIDVTQIAFKSTNSTAADSRKKRTLGNRSSQIRKQNN